MSTPDKNSEAAVYKKTGDDEIQLSSLDIHTRSSPRRSERILEMELKPKLVTTQPATTESPANSPQDKRKEERDIEKQQNLWPVKWWKILEQGEDSRESILRIADRNSALSSPSPFNLTYREYIKQCEESKNGRLVRDQIEKGWIVKCQNIFAKWDPDPEIYTERIRNRRLRTALAEITTGKPSHGRESFDVDDFWRRRANFDSNLKEAKLEVEQKQSSVKREREQQPEDSPAGKRARITPSMKGEVDDQRGVDWTTPPRKIIVEEVWEFVVSPSL
ncbi:hypothetical protein MBM_01040 [Drepanopeziza brunnea f. sp. 'multigermtubi' MB_m1]|uniref:Uncharacterized protein n=1 Tax=Marssonina brunnea f. sp. multigermtubi (strain MB_m1) TaxID=1072389 RepID=K1XHW8_MARBU|nr:uncharacterized protein MBM_01040 [Drepanopeziza brunnea f. sp. 'multigermtubi' MB_m1]EKD20358.1 hypothetical protein MBM_01040 [Drepanopeziza brunnea f. sp. 'multigermtubi' MB_m1]